MFRWPMIIGLPYDYPHPSGGSRQFAYKSLVARWWPTKYYIMASAYNRFRTIILFVWERRDRIESEFLLQPRVKPVIVFVATANSPRSAGGNHLISSKSFDALEFLLFWWLPNCDSVCLRVRFPHRGTCISASDQLIYSYVCTSKLYMYLLETLLLWL